MRHRPALIRCIPFGIYIGLLALDPLLEPLLPEAWDPRWLYGLRVALVALALALFWRSYEELVGPTSVRVREWFLGVVLGTIVFLLWVSLDVVPLALPPGDGFDPRTAGELDLAISAVRLAGAALVVPVMEELFWRSFILRWLQRPNFLAVLPGELGLKALFISSVLFATEHRLWFAGLLAGLAYGWIYKRSGNLWVPVLAHAITNGLLGVYVLLTGNWQFW
jgi:hypothetical protein